MSFNEKLKTARLAKGYTQSQIAEYLGVDKTTYCGYETGKRQPDVQKIKQLSKILGVSGDDLLETEFAGTRNKVTDDDIRFALFGGNHNITDDMYEEVKKFAAYVKQRESYGK